jgi:hypothetical protein
VLKIRKRKKETGNKGKNRNPKQKDKKCEKTNLENKKNK